MFRKHVPEAERVAEDRSHVASSSTQEGVLRTPKATQRAAHRASSLETRKTSHKLEVIRLTWTANVLQCQGLIPHHFCEKAQALQEKPLMETLSCLSHLRPGDGLGSSSCPSQHKGRRRALHRDSYVTTLYLY